MADNLDDQWFADKFISISEDLGGIKKGQQDQDKALTRAFKKLTNYGKRIRALETQEAVNQNIIQRNPGKTGVALTTIILSALAIISKLLEVW